jgi:hypothetical protein
LGFLHGCLCCCFFLCVLILLTHLFPV